jgi:hypothetical protein
MALSWDTAVPGLFCDVLASIPWMSRQWMLGGSSRFDADAHEFVAIFWGHGRGFGEREGFSKGFRKGGCKEAGRTFPWQRPCKQP